MAKPSGCAEFMFRWKPLETVKGAGTEETAPAARWGASLTALSDTKVRHYACLPCRAPLQHYRKSSRCRPRVTDMEKMHRIAWAPVHVT